MKSIKYNDIFITRERYSTYEDLVTGYKVGNDNKIVDMLGKNIIPCDMNTKQIIELFIMPEETLNEKYDIK